VNLGNPHEATVLELAGLVLRLTGSGSRIECRPLPVDDPQRRCPDIAEARARLGWEPRVALEDGLRRTVDYFRAVLRLPAALPVAPRAAAPAP
jgi:UDP-glucuronate decarboxylase